MIKVKKHEQLLNREENNLKTLRYTYLENLEVKEFPKNQFLN